MAKSKAIKTTKKQAGKPSALRQDGWKNILTNLGKVGKDKRMGARPDFTLVGQGTIEAAFQSDDIFGKVVERPPREMLRKGYCLKIPEDESNLGEAILERSEAFSLKKKLESALCWSRLYGGSGILVGINKQKPEDPLNLKNIPQVEYLTVLDRYQLSSTDGVQLDVTQENFGLPEYYSVSGGGSGLVSRVHHSRIIRFQGVEMPYNLMAANDYWGESVLTRLFNALRNFHTGHDSAATLLADFAQAIFKMKNLSEMISGGDEALVQKRLELVALTSSIINAIIIQDDEEYERKTTSVAGLSDLLDRINRRLVAATDMPHTVLLGESPSGLGATGNSEMTHWYDQLASEQQSKLKPALIKLMDIFFAEKFGPAKGKIPKKYEIVFNPLWQMDEKEVVTIRKTQADADKIYIDSGVLDPDEVAKSRFGGGEYSIETKVDFEARAAFEAQEGTEPEPDEDGPEAEEGADDAGAV
ncbi:MAG TPA: DUF1073 domain-containing protein [bacterium]|nr:DUF1073 domain-containing protein [bacterium]